MAHLTSSNLTGGITVRDVSKSFRLPYDRPSTLKQRVLHPVQSRLARRLDALKGVSFEIEPGEFFGIIGRNGSGKSTLLKCMAGIYSLDGGSIHTSGRVSPFIELGVGFNPELTARDNVVVNAALLGLGRSEALKRFDEIIAFAELEEFVDLKLKNYSSGMQVRLGFAAAIQADVDIYLVDEVLAVGDARFQEKCFEVFREMKRSGKTVVYVTHDLGTVERFCDRVMLLEGGQRIALGSPRQVIMTYRQRDLELERVQEHGSGPTPQRWGDGVGLVTDAWLEDVQGRRLDVIEQGTRVTFRAEMEIVESMESPIFGVVFKHEEGGVQVFVTNTVLDRVETGSFAPGDRVIYNVVLEMCFAEGSYTVSPAICYQDGQRFADWREDMFIFRVAGEQHSGGLVDLPHETRVERVGSRTAHRAKAPPR
jgi:ABC-type polysaccharide/polyol phosphate transport system ATPase subunit